MDLINMQEINEEHFNRKHIDIKLRAYINEYESNRINQGITLVREYMAKTYSYESKNSRIAQLKDMDIEQIVIDILVGICYYQREELFTSVTAQLASRLKFSDKKDAITTVAELVAVLCDTDAYDINKASREDSLMIICKLNLPKDLLAFIEDSSYLPPMLCEPKEILTNYDSGYLTHKESLILGRQNHHDGDLCIDVLNIMNRVSLKLDTQFLSTVEETSSDITLESIHEAANKRGKPIVNAKAKMRLQKALDNWDSFKKQSYRFYSMMVNQGNKFYLTNRVDKRGRIYASGYHITSQGNSFKKASLEFFHEEIVEGVPRY